MADKNILKEILLEWSERELPAVLPREFTDSLLASNSILTIIGPRRCGKTYLCYQLMQQLRRKHNPVNVIYLNFEDERLFPLSGQELTLLWSTLQELFELDPKQRLFLFMDEIQNIPHWSKWVRRITEQHANLKIILTGSSSKLLSPEIATELRGRSLPFVLLPLSFKEYLGWKTQETVDLKTILHSPKRAKIKKIFNLYFQQGGFPAALPHPDRESLLQEYYRAIFYRDIVERYDIKHVKLFEDFLKLTLNAFSSKSSISATAKTLASMGYSLSKNTLSQYFHYAQEAFLLFAVPVYSYKIKNQLRYPKKVYAVDHGLLQAVRFSFSEDYGRLLENIVFTELLRRQKEIYYFADKNECDFLIKEKNKITTAIQVSRSLENLSSKERELNGLSTAMKTFGLREGWLLTEDEYGDVVSEGLPIFIRPVWWWLLAFSQLPNLPRER